MTLEYLIATYGYPILLLGTFLEGESVLIIAGFLAHRGYLSLSIVILVAIVGSFIGDQLFYFLGRTKGMAFIEKRPRWQKRSKKVFEKLHRHKHLVIFGFRFVYGLRNITPFIIGASNIRPLYFFVLNLIGAIVWAVIIGGIGYLFGEIAATVIKEIKHYEIYIILGIALLGFMLWLRHIITKDET